MMENGEGKKRKIKGVPATANLVRDEWKELKHKFLQIESAVKKIYDATSLKSLAQIFTLSENHVLILCTFASGKQLTLSCP